MREPGRSYTRTYGSRLCGLNYGPLKATEVAIAVERRENSKHGRGQVCIVGCLHHSSQLEPEREGIPTFYKGNE